MLSDYDKGLFTPDCLVGVETDKGFITNVVGVGFLDIMYYIYIQLKVYLRKTYTMYII